MTNQFISNFSLFLNPASYRIRVLGRLNPDWSDRLQGLQTEPAEEPGYGAVTELSGVLADQAALMGVLTHLYDCGVALISLKVDGVAALDGWERKRGPEE